MSTPEAVQDFTDAQESNLAYSPLAEQEAMHDMPVERSRGFGRRVLRGAAAVAAAAGSLFAVGANPELASANAIPQGEKGEQPMPPGYEVDVAAQSGVKPNMIEIVNLTSIADRDGLGYAAIYSGAYQGTSTTNAVRGGEPTPNMAMVGTGPDGTYTLRIAEVDQHGIIDRIATMPDDPQFIDFFPSPKRSADTRNVGYNAGEVVKVSYGAEHAGQAAVINLTAAATEGPAWYAAYPCADGYRGTSTVNANGTRAAFDMVKVDINGDICFVGNADAAGLIVDTAGYIKMNLNAPSRILDTRQTGESLLGGQPFVMDFGAENAGKFFIGRLTTTNTQGAGYVSVYPTEKGFQNTSLVNPNGVDDTSGFLMGMTDSQGRLSIELRDSQSTDLIIDQSGLVDPEVLGINPNSTPARILDSRTGTGIPGGGEPEEPTEPPETDPDPIVYDQDVFFDPPKILEGVPVVSIYRSSDNSCKVRFDYDGDGVSDGSANYPAPCPL